MAHNAYVVRVPFARLDPVTGEVVQYARGAIIAHPDRMTDLAGSEHEAHAAPTWLPDDHSAIAAHRAPAAPAAAAKPAK